MVAALLAAFSFSFLDGVSASDPERRFRSNRPHYIEQIAQLPQTTVPRMMAFDWGGTGGVAVANIFYTLVYDESDEIGLPLEQRSMEWRQRACSISNMRTCFVQKSDPPRFFVDVKKMDSHFYLVTEIYQ